ncbi:hypothetical protein DBT54_09760, partial [Aerococcus loyolae]
MGAAEADLFGAVERVGAVLPFGAGAEAELVGRGIGDARRRPRLEEPGPRAEARMLHVVGAGIEEAEALRQPDVGAERRPLAKPRRVASFEERSPDGVFGKPRAVEIVIGVDRIDAEDAVEVLRQRADERIAQRRVELVAAADEIEVRRQIARLGARERTADQGAQAVRSDEGRIGEPEILLVANIGRRKHRRRKLLAIARDVVDRSREIGLERRAVEIGAIVERGIDRQRIVVRFQLHRGRARIDVHPRQLSADLDAGNVGDEEEITLQRRLPERPLVADAPAETLDARADGLIVGLDLDVADIAFDNAYDQRAALHHLRRNESAAERVACIV